MAVVKNCTRKSGTYIPEGGDRSFDYDNYLFQVEDASDNENLLFGVARYKDIKVSVKDFNKAMKNASPDTLREKDVVFAFDLNKHLIGIYANSK